MSAIPAPKVVSMRVRPSQASHLSFEVGGILGQCVELGAQVNAFNFAEFYAILGSMPTIPADTGRLLFDFLEIQAAVNPFTLAALRAESNKAALAKAINTRANAFYAKYANGPQIIQQMNNYYSPFVSNPNFPTKPVRLGVLASISQQQFELLNDAYGAEGRTGVVKNTESVLNSELTSKGSSTTTTSGRRNTLGDSEEIDYPVLIGPPDPNLAKFKAGAPNLFDEQLEASSETSTSTSRGCAREKQGIVNTDYGYRVPALENSAQYERAQISLIDEQFAQFMAGQNLPSLDKVFANELSSIDSDVFRTQIAYLNTILMSPIRGIVTGVYKNPGDTVRPGEPVIRVENSDEVYLVTTLLFPGRISLGSVVKVSTKLFDSPDPIKPVIGGLVVSVRGSQEDDQWELVVKCKNLDSSGSPILPLGYHFDYDDTTVSIS